MGRGLRNIHFSFHRNSLVSHLTLWEKYFWKFNYERICWEDFLSVQTWLNKNFPFSSQYKEILPFLFDWRHFWRRVWERKWELDKKIKSNPSSKLTTLFPLKDSRRKCENHLSIFVVNRRFIIECLVNIYREREQKHAREVY